MVPGPQGDAFAGQRQAGCISMRFVAVGSSALSKKRGAGRQTTALRFDALRFMLLSIIIVNYNVCHFLAHCLCSVEKAIAGMAAEILVVDNGSSDGSEAYLMARFPELIWINRPDNPGFAVANNVALQQARGQYILYLNPDTLLPETLLQQALALYTQSQCKTLLGVQMVDGTGAFLPESKRALPTPLVSFYKLSGLSRVFAKSAVFNKYALGHLPAHENHRVAVLAGAFILGKANVLMHLGGFDESFFMYGEDVDLSYRATLAANELCMYAGTLQLLHFKGESTQRQSPTYVYHFYQAMHLFVEKHFAGSGAWILRAGLHMAIAARKAVQLVKPARTQHTQHVARQWKAVGGAAFVRLLHAQYADWCIETIDWESLAHLPAGTQIIWCPQEANAYAQCIGFMAMHTQKQHRYYWYHPRAGSIIGSAGKDFVGAVWA